MKVIKNPIFMFIFGATIFSSITTVAISQINASQITYTKNDTDITVDVALDDLYTKLNKYLSVTTRLSLDYGNETVLYPILLKNKYKYVNMKLYSNEGATCSLTNWDTSETISQNVDYETNNNSMKKIRFKHTNTTGWCDIDIIYHN